MSHSNGEPAGSQKAEGPIGAGDGIGRWVAGGRKLFWVVAAVVLASDLLTKQFLWHPPGAGVGPKVLIPKVLRIVSHPGNPGGALGLPGSPVFYAAAALLGLALIIFLFVTTPPARVFVHAALGMLAGGALGNLVDRAALGFVRDFVDLHWGDVFHWHTFNLADAAICCGFAVILWKCVIGFRAGEESGRRRAEGSS